MLCGRVVGRLTVAQTGVSVLLARGWGLGVGQRVGQDRHHRGVFAEFARIDFVEGVGGVWW